MTSRPGSEERGASDAPAATEVAATCTDEGEAALGLSRMRGEESPLQVGRSLATARPLRPTCAVVEGKGRSPNLLDLLALLMH